MCDAASMLQMGSQIGEGIGNRSAMKTNAKASNLMGLAIQTRAEADSLVIGAEFMAEDDERRRQFTEVIEQNGAALAAVSMSAASSEHLMDGNENERRRLSARSDRGAKFRQRTTLRQGKIDKSRMDAEAKMQRIQGNALLISGALKAVQTGAKTYAEYGATRKEGESPWDWAVRKTFYGSTVDKSNRSTFRGAR